MKRTLLLTLSTAILLTSCASKKNDEILIPPTTVNTNTVIISGSSYSTVVIGTQTWTSVNYYGAGGVYYNGSTTNDALNGKLYTITEAKAIALPTGWRIPTSDDYNELLNSQSGNAKALMATTSWTLPQGTNTSKFNAYASGYFAKGVYADRGSEAVFITTSMLAQYPTIPACFNIYQENGASGATLSDFLKVAADRGSLRFVKDN